MARRWLVRFGPCACVYFTRYHAEQMMRALTLNGTPCTLEVL